MSNRARYEMLLGSLVMFIQLKQSCHLQINGFRKYMSCSQCVLVLSQIIKPSIGRVTQAHAVCELE